jgi:hypothetical protein
MVTEHYAGSTRVETAIGDELLVIVPRCGFARPVRPHFALALKV